MGLGPSDFLVRLLDAAGPSGFETEAARVWRAEAERIAGKGAVHVDVVGNSWAGFRGRSGPRVLLAGHVDEIGVMATHVDEQGFVFIDGIGGWDPQVLVGQRIRFLTRLGPLLGVVGRKPIHLIKPDERDKAVKLSDLWVDVAAQDRSDVERRGLRVGDPGIVDSAMVELGESVIAARSVDNRVGAYVVLEVLRELAGDSSSGADVVAVATAQEEIAFHGGGARPLAYQLDPRFAIVVDVTFSSDVPDVEKRQVGDHRLGGGPVLSRGSSTNAAMFERLVEIAGREGISYSVQATPRASSTDADAIYLQRGGIATALISIPNRYMHSPHQMIDLRDLHGAVRLIAGFCRSLAETDEFLPR